MRLIIPTLACLALSTPSLAEEPRLSTSTGFDYSTGKYGSADSSDTWFLPLNLKYQHGNLGFKLSMSYLWMSGPQNVTPEGEPLAGTARTATASGFGDVIAAVSASVLDATTSPVGVDVTGKIKFGTADPGKALGTGENDYSLQISLYTALGAWTPYLDLSYRWKGDPPGVDYSNVWYATAGTNFRLNRAWSVGADYTWRQKLTPTSAEIREATLYLTHKLDERRKFNVYGVAGFSDASPDWETGLMLTQSF